MPRSRHGGDGCGIDLAARFRSAGPGDRIVAGVVLEEAECHLRAAGVVDAEKQHDGLAVVRQRPSNSGECLESLPSETFGEKR